MGPITGEERDRFSRDLGIYGLSAIPSDPNMRYLDLGHITPEEQVDFHFALEEHGFSALPKVRYRRKAQKAVQEE
jgi:hypothetical protein